MLAISNMCIISYNFTYNACLDICKEKVTIYGIECLTGCIIDVNTTLIIWAMDLVLVVVCLNYLVQKCIVETLLVVLAILMLNTEI